MAAALYHSTSPTEPGAGTLSPFSLAHSARTSGDFRNASIWASMSLCWASVKSLPVPGFGWVAATTDGSGLPSTLEDDAALESEAGTVGDNVTSAFLAAGTPCSCGAGVSVTGLESAPAQAKEAINKVAAPNKMEGRLRKDRPLATSPVLGTLLISPAQPVPLAMIAQHWLAARIDACAPTPDSSAKGRSPRFFPDDPT